MNIEQLSGKDEKHQNKYVAFIGQLKVEFEVSPVKARDMLRAAGAEPPEDFVLEALHGRGGKVVAEYSADDDVPLGAGEEKFFRAVPRGGGRA